VVGPYLSPGRVARISRHAAIFSRFRAYFRECFAVWRDFRARAPAGARPVAGPGNENGQEGQEGEGEGRAG